MKTVSIVKASLGGGAALLLIGLLVAAPAQAAAGASLPCNPGALIAAINAAKAAGGHHQPGPGLHLQADLG